MCEFKLLWSKIKKQKVTHEKKTLIEVLPETQLELTKGFNNSGYPLPTDCDLDSAFYQGQGVVVLDGVSYNVTITTIGKTRECGNKARFDGTGDTGEPFYINISGRSKAFMLYYLDEYENTVPSSVHTLQILGVNTETKIEPHYLPDGGFGYEALEKTIITPEQEYTGFFEPGDSVLPGGTTMIEVPFLASPAPDKIWVNWDGTVYECDAVHDTYEDGITVSQYIAGTLENLVFGIMASTNTPDSALVLLMGDSTTHTIGIYTMAETVHKIDPKFLPESSGGGLPVVDLNLESIDAALEGNGVIDMPEKDMAILETARQNGMPCVFRIAAGGDGSFTARIANLDYTSDSDVECNDYLLKDWCGATFLFRYVIGTGKWICSIAQS